MLDFVYNEYLMMKDLGISGFETREEIEEAWAKDFVVGLYRKSILKGKMVNLKTLIIDRPDRTK